MANALAAELPSFDWRAPDYDAVFQERMRVLARLRARPELLPPLRAYYR
ncbi:MAG: hypothetical protein JOZ79_09205, partial [Sphingomonas sp.]|nr:hypothetical protein [Sphingomonas sp.]